MGTALHNGCGPIYRGGEAAPEAFGILRPLDNQVEPAISAPQEMWRRGGRSPRILSSQN